MAGRVSVVNRNPKGLASRSSSLSRSMASKSACLAVHGETNGARVSTCAKSSWIGQHEVSRTCLTPSCETRVPPEIDSKQSIRNRFWLDTMTAARSVMKRVKLTCFSCEDFANECSMDIRESTLNAIVVIG
jgi:hypothetical protein